MAKHSSALDQIPPSAETVVDGSIRPADHRVLLPALGMYHLKSHPHFAEQQARAIEARKARAAENKKKKGQSEADKA